MKKISLDARDLEHPVPLQRCTKSPSKDEREWVLIYVTQKEPSASIRGCKG